MENITLKQWWDGLSKTWQSLFLLNLHLNRLHDFNEDAKGVLKLGTNPFMHYAFKHGSKFIEPVVTDEIIAQVGELRFLYAAECELDDILPLASLPQLSFIDLCFNQLTSIDVLKDHTGIKYLYVENNNLISLSPLANSTNLEELDARENKLTGLHEISHLQQLTFLDVGSNEISDINGVGNMLNLEELQCDLNQISDLGPLQGLNKLRIVTLVGNQITHINVLLELPALQYADLSYMEGLDENEIDALLSKGVEVVYNK